MNISSGCTGLSGLISDISRAKHHCRNHELIEWRILAIRQSIPAIRDRAVIEAKSAAVKVIVQLIRIVWRLVLTGEVAISSTRTL